LRGSFSVKSVTAILKDYRGFKAVKKIAIYVNNNQTLDLNEMKGNLNLWQKVAEIAVDISAGNQFTANLPLAVTATNIMFEFHVVNLNKPAE
jgi:hypothetical protein